MLVGSLLFTAGAVVGLRDPARLAPRQRLSGSSTAASRPHHAGPTRSSSRRCSSGSASVSSCSASSSIPARRCRWRRGSHTASASACDEARALASLALDGALTDDVGRRVLRRHLGECAACARFAAEIASATALLRGAPLEPYRCGPLAARRLGPAAGAHRAHWARWRPPSSRSPWASPRFLRRATRPTPLRPVVAAVDVPAGAPVKLPIGQKSAESDFADGPNALTRRSGARATGARHTRRRWPSTTRAFEALTFDCYGTLIDWEAGLLAALREALPAVEAADDELLEAYAAQRPRRSAARI